MLEPSSLPAHGLSHGFGDSAPMTNADTHPNDPGQRRAGSPDAPPTDASARAGEPLGGPPGYDTDKEDYAGISTGALHTIEGLHDARDFAEMIVDTIREGLLILDLDLRVVAANESFYDQFGVGTEETVGRLVYDLGDGHWDIPELRKLLEEILPHQRVLNDFEVVNDFESVGERVMLLNARRLDDHQLILLAIEDVTERRKGEHALRELNRALEARVEERTRQVRKLSRALALAEQEERHRIAYVLHDDLQQVLVGAQMVAGDVGQVRALLDKAIDLTRALSHELSPPLLRGEDLADLLQWLAERKRELYGLEVEVEVRNDASMPETDLRILTYQIVRELLFNVVKHAGTKRARVTAERMDDHVRLVVEDEGAGCDPALLEETGNLGLGLPGARERLEIVGGRLGVESRPGAGTRVTMEVPLRRG